MLLQRLIAAYKQRTAVSPGGRIPALDGLRAFFVFSVVAFHLFEQSWLSPSFAFLGRSISLDPFLRTGYLWVDGMLLLSGFLLYLPFARSKEAGRPFTARAGFYRRRVMRIVPSYLLHLLIVFLVVALPERRYATFWQGARDWLAHLTFTHPLFPFSSRFTPLNGALWTVGIEMQFYLIFPLLARAFDRTPLLVYAGGTAAALAFRGYAMSVPNTPMLINQLPAFLDVYLHGMVAAMVFARFEKQKDDGLRRALFSAVTLAAVMGLAVIVRHQAGMRDIETLRVGQMSVRYAQSVLSALLLLGVSLGLGGIRLALGNRMTAYLAAISYQVYMWHQMVAIQFKKWRIPASEHVQPHMAYDRPWQVLYVLLVVITTFVIATAITYLVERPVLERFSRPGRKRR
ncbi:MAG: acyltransferase [Clostridiales bacterium]|nr:acyltransferase [Clostridiales bacterium]